MELGAHLLPAVGVVLRGCWTPGLPRLHQGEALAPEGKLGQVVRKKLTQFEPRHWHHPNGEVQSRPPGSRQYATSPTECRANRLPLADRSCGRRDVSRARTPSLGHGVPDGRGG